MKNDFGLHGPLPQKKKMMKNFINRGRSKQNEM